MTAIAAAWPTVKFGAVADFKNGLNFAAGAVGRGIKIVGVGDFGTRSELNDFSGLGQVEAPELDRSYLLKADDILFVRSNGNKALIGRAMVIGVPREPVTHSGFTIRARITDSEMDPRFVCLMFRTDEIRSQIHRLGAGSQISNLSQELLVELTLPRPPLALQKRIVAVSRAAAAAGDFLERREEAARRRRVGLMQCVLHGKRRLRGFSEPWRMVPIGDLARQISVRNADGDQLPVLSCTKADGLVDSLEYFGRRVFSEDLSTYKVVRRGQFAYATNHIEEGSIGYQTLVNEGLISPMYTVFETTTPLVNDRFLFMVFKTEHYRRLFSASTSASVDRRGGLRWEDFSRIRVPVPPRKEQDAIVGLLSVADREVDLTERARSVAARQSKGFLRHLVMRKNPSETKRTST